MDIQTPIYSSRIIRNYLDYIQKYYPDEDVKTLLKNAGLSPYEVNDASHWFSQSQINTFHATMDLMISDSDISRKTGRFVAVSESLSLLRQYAMGFIKPQTAYRAMERLFPKFSRGHVVKTEQLQSNKIEVTVWTKPGVAEMPFQCQNRIGSFEGLAKLFTTNWAKVDHPECLHDGAGCCRYIITWEKLRAHTWKRISAFLFIASLLITGLAAFHLTAFAGVIVALAGILMALLPYTYSAYLEKNELTDQIEAQGDAAQAQLDSLTIRSKNAALLQDLGRITSSALKRDKLIVDSLKSLQTHLDFDSGFVVEACHHGSSLAYIDGYGFDHVAISMTDKLNSTSRMREFLLEALQAKTPLVINATDKTKKESDSTQFNLARALGLVSSICLPLIYEHEHFGLLVLGYKTNRSITKIDLNFLEGISFQIATSLATVRSFGELQKSEERYRLLADNVRDVIWVMSIDTQRVIYISPSIEDLMGYTPDEVKNLQLKDFMTSESFELAETAIMEELDQDNQTGLDPNRMRTIELQQTHKNGKLIWTEITASFLRDAQGRPVSILGTTRDISERKRSELEKKDLEARLRQSQKMEAVGTLAGGIAHDFNNILAAIMGYAEMAQFDIRKESPAYASLEQILKASYRAKGMVEQILAFSRQSDFERKPIKVNQIIIEVLKLLRASLPSTIEIRNSLPNEEIVIIADSTQFHQMLMNLCTNAHHSMAEDGGTLTIDLSTEKLQDEVATIHSDLAPGTYMKLNVSDTGRGIDAAIMERIFDPYFTTKSHGQGTGMGLSVVHGIVKGLGGAITAQSSVGLGSQFTVYVPRVDMRFDEKEAPSIQTINGSERILFVDDEEALVDIATQMLERLGYSVDAYLSPTDALKSFKLRPDAFDVVITDMTMPQMTGDLLAQELLQIRSDIPIILCTGYSERLTEEKIKELGIKGYLMKPFAIDSLGQTLREALAPGTSTD